MRRLEVFTGAGRRRKWSNDDKARVVAETEASGDSVSAVARRQGLLPQQLFGCRRQLREAAAGHSSESAQHISRTKLLVRLILNQIGRRLTEDLQAKGRCRRLWLMLDEFPALGPTRRYFS